MAAARPSRVPRRGPGVRCARCGVSRCPPVFRGETSPVLSFPAGRRPAGSAGEQPPGRCCCRHGRCASTGCSPWALTSMPSTKRTKCPKVSLRCGCARSLPPRFQPVAGEAARLELSSQGWFLLCSSARSACASSWLQTSPALRKRSPGASWAESFSQGSSALSAGKALGT